jgi:hypothetical protein
MKNMKTNFSFLRSPFSILLLAAAMVFAGCEKNDLPGGEGTITLTVTPHDSIVFAATAQQLVVDWGDGSAAETHTKTTIQFDDKKNYLYPVRHTYAGSGIYTVQIKGEGLTGFNCAYSNATSLNASKCPALEELWCEHNQITSLNTGGCPMLWKLSCFDNHLTSSSLDISGCPVLQVLDCHINQLDSTALNVVFTALPTRTKDYGYLSIYDNPGADSCNRTIAENKGWVFIIIK